MRMNLSKKLLAGFSGIFILICIVAAASFLSINVMSSATNDIVNEVLPLHEAVDGLLDGLVNQETGMRGYIAFGDDTFLEPYENGKQSVEENLAYLEEVLQDYPEMLPQLEEAKTAISAVWSFFNREVGLVKLGNLSTAQKNIGEGKEVFDAFRAVHAQMSENVDQLLEEDWQRIQSQKVKCYSLTLLAILVVIGVMLAIVTYFIKVISKPIVAISGNLKDVAEGHLDIEITKAKNNDEIGDLVIATDQMVKNLRQVLSKVNSASNQVIESSEELAAAAEESTQANETIAKAVSDSTKLSSEQIESVDHVSDAMQKMNEEIQSIAQNCDEMSSLSINSANATKQGIVTVNEVVEQMQAIGKSSVDTESIIVTLDAHSNEIVRIIDMITDITEQTNLLALNAAIEAARAGEYGKGFAVVANEIRVLAEDSQKSANQIAEFINQMKQQTQKAVVLVKQGNTTVKAGIEKTEQVSHAFEMIADNFNQVNEKINVVSESIIHISKDSNEMVTSLDEVKRAADEGARSNECNLVATEQQLATAQEIAASAQMLSTVAEELNVEVSKFVL